MPSKVASWPRVAESLANGGGQSFLASDPPAVRWLTGFGGSAGVCVVGHQGAVLVVDQRYGEIAAEYAGAGLEVSVAPMGTLLVDASVGIARHLMPPGAPVLHRPQTMSVADMELWRAALPAPLERVGRWLVELRMVKTPAEQDGLRASAALLRDLFGRVAGWLEAGAIERALAARIVGWSLAQGADGMAFSPIVASGPLSSRPHAGFSDRVLGAGEPVTLDLGVMVDGWASDMTRTWAVPGAAPEKEVAKIHDLVLRAHAAGCEAVRPGTTFAGADKAARTVIDEAGHARDFGHGLGHGVGRETHEPPRLGFQSEGELAAGMVVTVEPGVYLAGRFGVRVEDTVIVTAEGNENLGEGVQRELIIR
ncbi:M24 family metallopeptidase [bacterium]|nr:M24 family metallopeptidase [bacterium]